MPRLPVSNFARDLLSKFHDEPVFSVNPVQHPIYKRVGVMGQAKVSVAGRERDRKGMEGGGGAQ